MEENNNMMRATKEWMSENYDRLNHDLFGGQLGDCDFEVFTSGRGSQGGVLGWFKITNKNVKVDRHTRRLFANYGFDRKYIDKNNFAYVCMPRIELNGNYSGAESSFLDTLVHEMCHYYDYMFGICPKQALGPSFRNISSMISERSNGRFSVQRLASAETMSGYKLDQEMQDKRNRRMENKKSNAMAVLVYKDDGKVELTMLSRSNTSVLRRIYEFYSKPNRSPGVLKMITSTDPKLIELIYQSGYRSIMRTWKLWDVRNKPFAKNAESFEHDEWINNINESTKMNIKNIIKETIEEYVNRLNDDNDNGIDVAGIDLGAVSPLELVNN